MTPYAVVGAGSWGTALAAHLARYGHRVALWCRRTELAEAIRTTTSNPDYLPGIELPPAVVATADLERALDGAAVVIGAVPSRYARPVLARALAAIAPEAPLVLATKGFDAEERLRMSELARSLWRRRRDLPVAVVSGPSFAREVAAGQPTALVAASETPAIAQRVQADLSHGHVRVYRHDDLVGVELGGALKNVIALAAGMLAGLGMGSNSVAALITRGLHEMTRLGVACGARAATFSGLSGLGDLVLTCTDAQSRNYRVGRALARGESLDAVLGGMREVPEGPWTVRVARALAVSRGIEMPVTDQVYRILYEGDPARQAVGRLLGRRLKSEL